MCGVSVNYERKQVVDFSHWANIGDIGFISQWPQLKPNNWTIAAPFSWHLWLLTLATMLVVWMILCRLSHESPTFIATKLYQIMLNRGSFLF